MISDAAFEVIHSSKHGDKVKSETANAIGRVGCILAMYNDGDFDCFWKYYKNIWQRFGDGSKKEKDLVYYVKIFNVILFSKSSPTASVMEALAEDLQRTLEETEIPLLVPPLINCLVKISELNPRLFEPRFKVCVRLFYLPCFLSYYYLLFSNEYLFQISIIFLGHSRHFGWLACRPRTKSNTENANIFCFVVLAFLLDCRFGIFCWFT